MDGVRSSSRSGTDEDMYLEFGDAIVALNDLKSSVDSSPLWSAASALLGVVLLL